MGIAEPANANKRILWSSQRFCLIDEKIPRGIAVATANIKAKIESSSVAANLYRNASETSSFKNF